MEKTPDSKKLETQKNATEEYFYDSVAEEEWLKDQKEKAEQKGDEKTIEKIQGYLSNIKKLMDKLDAEVKELERQGSEDEKMRNLGQAVSDIVLKSQENENPMYDPENTEKARYDEYKHDYTKFNPFTGREEHFKTKEELQDFNEYLKGMQKA